MKKITLIPLVLLAFFFVFSTQTQAQNFSKLDVSPLDIASYPTSHRDSNKLIKITYSRPQLKGRKLSKLAPAGKVWRTGANEASELTLYTDMKLGDKKIKAGTYTFYTIPGETTWTAIINSDTNVWGSYYYNESKDVARISVPATTSEESLEAFSIVFEESDAGVAMHLGWGNVRLAVPFSK
ncbi:MAG: DUF2911 domain-containing protein [Flavobacteriaceae bacterium]|nr:DUF2911 domain-containing protein [Flavobacteriaceae bacterium]